MVTVEGAEEAVTWFDATRWRSRREPIRVLTDVAEIYKDDLSYLISQ